MKIRMFPTMLANANLPVPEEWRDKNSAILANGMRLIDLSEPGAREKRSSLKRKAV
ncbi:hypothetical protein GCM10027090_29570 [Sinomonas soli]